MEQRFRVSEVRQWGVRSCLLGRDRVSLLTRLFRGRKVLEGRDWCLEGSTPSSVTCRSPRGRGPSTKRVAGLG